MRMEQPKKTSVKSAGAFVSPFYHEAKNEITRPNHFVGCSRYLVEKWLPRLGPLGFSLVLHLRSLGYYNPTTGELRDAIQINQNDLSRVLGVSLDTLQREMKRNPALSAFVRVEKFYQRNQTGHLQRLDSVYYIAMDDPLIPEDEPLLQGILERKQAEAREQRAGRAIIRPAAEPSPHHKPQIAACGVEDRMPQSAAYGNLDRKPQIAVNLLDIRDATDIPKSNNIPAEAASKTDVVAFLAVTGVRINETITATISRDVAQKMAALPNIEEIAQRQARYLPFRKVDKGGTWGGLWRKSIEGDWPAPDAYLRHEREERQRTARQITKAQSQQEQQDRGIQQAEVAARVQVSWERLDAAEQEILREEAVGRLQPTLRKRYKECVEHGRALPKIMQDTLDSLCDSLMRQRHDLPARTEQSQRPPPYFRAPEVSE